MKNSSNWMNVFFYWNWTYFVHIRIKLFKLNLKWCFCWYLKMGLSLNFHISTNIQHWNYGANIQLLIYFEVFIVVSTLGIIFEIQSFSKRPLLVNFYFKMHILVSNAIVHFYTMIYVVRHLLGTLWSKTFVNSVSRWRWNL